MSLPAMRFLFILAGLYDFIIGAVFLFAGPQLFDKAGVPHPNHWGYVQFAALLLMIFGVMFFAIAQDVVCNSNLIFYGLLLKLSYCGIVGYYWLTTDCPGLFKPFAIIDAVMFLLFAWAYVSRRPAQGVLVS